MTLNQWGGGSLDQIRVPQVGLPVPPYDFVVYTPDDINTYAVDTHTGVVVTSGTDWGAVITALGVLAAASLNGHASVFIQEGEYPATTLAECGGALSLFGAGGLAGVTYIDYSGASGGIVAVHNPNLLQGINFSFGSGVSVGIAVHLATSTYFLDVKAVAAAVADVELEFAGAPVQPVFIIASRIGNLTIDSGSVNNVIMALIDVLTDNSGGINFIENTHLSDVQSAPSGPSTSPVVNNLGTKVEVVISIGTTATQVTKNATVVFQSTTAIPACVTLTLNEGESITFDQTTGVSWEWFAV